MLVAAAAAALAIRRRPHHRISQVAARSWSRSWGRLTEVWLQAGMQCKLKAAFGFYQCVAAVPEMFDMRAPDDLDPSYILWAQRLMEIPSMLGIELVIPPVCIGHFRAVLVLGALWPVGLVLLCTVGVAMTDSVSAGAPGSDGGGAAQLVLGKDKVGSGAALERVRGGMASASRGLHSALPLTLVLTFILVPRVSNQIFNAFLCVQVRSEY